MKRRSLYLAISIAILIASITGASVQFAAAGQEVCGQACVIVIEVDGLEPKDVTPQTTPFMWALAHPDAATTATGDATNAGPGIAADQLPAISGRHGFIWEAARGPMTASTATAAYSLLTGSYAEQDNVPADHFYEAGTEHVLGSDGETGPEDIESSSPTLPELMGEQGDSQSLSYVGDPRLKSVAEAGGEEGHFSWSPANTDSVPAYCTPPQDVQTAQAMSPDSTTCPTPDMKTADKAYTDLAGTGGKVSFAYIHFAELGAVKRLYGDVDDFAVAPEDPASQAVTTALATTDAAIGYFVSRYNQDQGAKWGSTVLFVVGNHGYESAPVANRVPDPDPSATPSMGLADYVKSITNDATLVPQGTMATVYVNNDPDGSKLAAVYNGLHDTVNTATACQQTGGCVDEVLYTDPAKDPDQADHKNSVAFKHPGWRLHALDEKGVPTGTDGDLIVTLKPGWASGQTVPVGSSPTDSYSPDGGQITNPYMGSAGGPRNRAIAAIANGPAGVIRQVPAARYPVAQAAQDDGHCPESATELNSANLSVDAANATPGDDANAPGHECQAETVDFAPTIAALLRISVADKQLGGRFLQEAFIPKLSPVRDDEELPPPPPEELPPPPEPDIYIPPPPPPPEGDNYDGLVKDLSVQVTDAKGCGWSKARRGVKLDYLTIKGHFGKPFAAVTLTFYKRAEAKKSSVRKRAARSAAVTLSRTQLMAAAAAGGCQKPGAKTSSATAVAARDLRAPLQAIAHFDPFKIKRGQVVLKLRIPDLFKPTYVGVHVREARELDEAKQIGGKMLKFEPFGPAGGRIVKIADASKLHATKSAKKAKVKAGGR